jgi:hypothetical protein
MNISHQLLQPLVDRIEAEYNELIDETKPHDSDEIKELRLFIDKKLRQLQMVKVSLSYMNKDEFQTEETQANLRDTLRQQKLELRFARRRWKRQSAHKANLSESPNRSRQETVAA